MIDTKGCALTIKGAILSTSYLPSLRLIVEDIPSSGILPSSWTTTVLVNLERKKGEEERVGKANLIRFMRRMIWGMILLVTLIIAKIFTETISPKMDWLIDWLIDYWNLQKQVWWEFTARKNAGISEKFLRGILQKSFLGKFWKVLQKVLQENFNGEKFYGGNGEPDLDWDLESCWSVTAPVEGHRFTSFSRFT